MATETTAVLFRKPANWTFEAGQFSDVTLLNPQETDPEGEIRSFSIASASFEKSLKIATRMWDTAVKRVLKTLPLGTDVKIEGPFGELRLPDNMARPAVIVSGEIGIIPFRSVLLQVAYEKRPRRTMFLYANRRPEDAPFLDELRTLVGENASFTGIPTMSAMERSHFPWDGERGCIGGHAPSMTSRYSPASDCVLPAFSGQRNTITPPADCRRIIARGTL